jgi:putative endonuclease
MCPPSDARFSSSPALSPMQGGRLAEALAAAYLELQGHQILDRNVRDGPRELDLITRKDQWLVVVEVRFRGRSDRGLPEETVDRRKRTHLLRAGQSYWLQKGRAHGTLRFDLITIQPEPDGLRLRHHSHFIIPNQFRR